MPERIQLRRSKGWRMPPNTVKVDRSTRWGNPIRVGTFRNFGAADAVRLYRQWLHRELAVRSWENSHGKPPALEEVRRELGGKNLACWCPLGSPCHADVLLEVANS